jgi:hypothetical protein
VLFVAGVTGIILYAVGAPDQLAEGGALGGLRGGLIIVSGLCVGSAAALALLAVVRRKRRDSVAGTQGAAEQ